MLLVGVVWLGVECGRTVSPFPHAHSTSMVDLTMASKNHRHHSPGHSNLSTTMLKHSRTSDYCAFSPLSVHLHAGAGVLLIPTHRIFLVLLTQFLLYGFCGWSGCILSSQTDSWVAVVSLTLQCVLLGSSLHFGDGSLFIFTHRHLLCLISRS